MADRHNTEEPLVRDFDVPSTPDDCEPLAEIMETPSCIVSGLSFASPSTRRCDLSLINGSDYIVTEVRVNTGDGTQIQFQSKGDSLRERNSKKDYGIEQETLMDDIRFDVVYDIQDKEELIGCFGVSLTWSVSDSTAKCQAGFADSVDSLNWQSLKDKLKSQHKKLHVNCKSYYNRNDCEFLISLQES